MANYRLNSMSRAREMMRQKQNRKGRQVKELCEKRSPWSPAGVPAAKSQYLQNCRQKLLIGFLAAWPQITTQKLY